jgi:hypothetical protein
MVNDENSDKLIFDPDIASQLNSSKNQNSEIRRVVIVPLERASAKKLVLRKS